MAEIASFDCTLLLQAICLHNYIRLDSSCIIHFCEKNNAVSPLCLLCLTSLVFCVIKCFSEISRKPRHFTIQASAGKTFDLPDPLPLLSCVIRKGEHQRGSMRLEDLLTHQLYFWFLIDSAGKMPERLNAMDFSLITSIHSSFFYPCRSCTPCCGHICSS